jgi:ATP-dependent DNA helicase RecG
MLTTEAVQALISDSESDRVELTVSTTKTDKFGEAICAFANDMGNHRQPGYLVIGVDDQGRPNGLKVTDQLLQNLAALRADGNILPIPALTVSRHALEGGEVAVVEVQPSDLPPVRYKGQVWIRVGPRKAIASEQEERILTERRTALVATFDVSPVPGASLAELSVRRFEEYRQLTVAPEVIEANHRSVEVQLASQRFFDVERGLPTVAGVLMFGSRPRYFLPGAWVMFLRFAGTSMAHRPIDELELKDDLPRIVEILTNKIIGYNRAAPVPAEGLREKQVSDYPQWALRELLLNALIHRDYRSTAPVRFYWYDDRIEIQNPGGVFGTVTRENFTWRNDDRNPVLAECMRALGFINRFGYGIQRAQALLADGGNPPAEFEVDDHTFRVVVRKRLQTASAE